MHLHSNVQITILNSWKIQGSFFITIIYETNKNCFLFSLGGDIIGARGGKGNEVWRRE